MEFRLEKDMISPIHDWLAGQVVHVKREFRTPWGYCDLVGCTLSLTKVNNRLRLSQHEPIGSLESVDVLWQIPDEISGKSIELESLAAFYAPWMDVDRVAQHVALLERKRFVVRNQTGELQKRNGWFPLHKRLIAIEAKLARVEEAVYQAARHLTYADEAYVALPSRLARRIPKSQRERQFRDLGLGLLAVTNQTVRVLIEPGNHAETDQVLQAHSVEKFWQLRFRGNSA